MCGISRKSSCTSTYQAAYLSTKSLSLPRILGHQAAFAATLLAFKIRRKRVAQLRRCDGIFTIYNLFNRRERVGKCADTHAPAPCRRDTAHRRRLCQARALCSSGREARKKRLGIVYSVIPVVFIAETRNILGRAEFHLLSQRRNEFFHRVKLLRLPGPRPHLHAGQHTAPVV